MPAIIACGRWLKRRFGFKAIRRSLARVFLIFGFVLSSHADEWVRAGLTTNALVWGRTGGLQFAIPPAGFHAPEPRGLIRIGYPVLTNGGYDLINFIAIEPVVDGRKGFSELEQSQLDRKPGKRLTLVPAAGAATNETAAGHISTIAPGVEEIAVALQVEPFENGAKVGIEIRQRSDEPDEIHLTTHALPGSARMQLCILTATMGNRTRARQIWLKNETLNSTNLFSGYRDFNFAPHKLFTLDRLKCLANGDVIVAITNDENDPGSERPFSGPHFWNYGGSKVTQYWKKSAADPGIGTELMAVVNARFVYWGSRQPIPHGVSFENFELREPFSDGQTVIFGVTRKGPQAFGLQKSSGERE